MRLNRSTTSSFSMIKQCFLLIATCLSLSLPAQEILPGSLYAADNLQRLQLSAQEAEWIKQHRNIRVAVRNGWMPIEFQLENQKHKGVSIQYLQKISQLTGLKFTLVDYHDNITSNEVSLVTGIRGKHTPTGFNLLATPYLETPNAIYVASHNKLYQSEIQLDQLSHKTVAVFRNGPLSQKLRELIPGVKIKLVDIADEAFEYLDAGLIDAYVGNELVLDYHLDFHKIKAIRKSGITAITSTVFMAASDTDPMLRSILNKATLQIGTNPPDILEVWRRSPENPLTPYLVSALSFFAVLLLIQLLKLYQANKKQAVAAQHAIWFQANHDFLTKLPNRFQLKHELDQALQVATHHPNKLGVMIIDLDNFKEINDTAGHAVGDEVLIKVAARIQSIILPPNLTARFGGDEFLIVIQQEASEERLRQLCTQLMTAMAPPFTIQQKSFVVSISIGVSLFPDNSLQAEELIMFADQALYQAKRTGKNKFILFNEGMHDAFTKKTHLSNELRYAVQKNQLHLQYQPIFNLTDLRCEKVEALLRWQHPEFGTLSPEVFISIAEENGYIIELGEWVFQQTIRDFEQIKQRFGPVEICINISPLQFSQSAPIHHFISSLAARSISGDHFCFEITEGLLLEPSSNVVETLNSMHEHGIKLAIDDFGTGYSSLAYLNKFKIDYVKIDKSFIKNITVNLNDQALCKTIIFMGKQLNIRLIAEGVETLEQEHILKEMGCQYSQGYYRARPSDLEDL
ncbi:EAL domain-containing protein [Methylophilus sp. Q8]|uniref:EAL domain-containing protein n=1 Tax=Methylophilus sp. Q8 TaxID=1506586 RepID=UPI000645664F|nr:EAL domain-containing protein [Methylophilus sp. Q8]